MLVDAIVYFSLCSYRIFVFEYLLVFEKFQVGLVVGILMFIYLGF